MTRKTKSLKFEYCECGCKGHEANPGAGLHFWLYNDLKGTFFLHQGHGHVSPLINKFSTFDRAVGAATKLAKQKMKQALKQYQAAFA